MSLLRPAPLGYTASAALVLKTGQIVTGKAFSGPATTPAITSSSAARSVAMNDAQVLKSRIDASFCALKVGSGPLSKRLTVADMLVRDCDQAIFAANLADSTFTGLDLQCRYEPAAPSGRKHHVIYVERGCTGLTFRKVVSAGGDSWPIHLYNWEPAPSSDILFDGLDITCKSGCIIVSGHFARVTFKNFKARGEKTSGDLSVLCTDRCEDIVFDGFEAWGGYALLENSGAARVTLRNGIYHGTRLVVGDKSGVTVEPTVRLVAA